MKRANTRAKRPKNDRTFLLARKLELSSGWRAKLDTLAGPDGAVLHDLAPVFYEQFIEAALARIHSEEYGVCLDCDNTISSGRLEAIPWAVRCIACQELFSSGSDSSFANDSEQLQVSA
jgi:DnaK suppressor protein